MPPGVREGKTILGFTTLPRIVCPACKQEQTGNIKIATHAIAGQLMVGDHYAICVMKDCKYIMRDEELADLIATKVKFPADIYK